MRIEIPVSAYPITRLHIEGPFGIIEADFEKSHKHFDFEIPAGISIDQVGVRYEFLDSRQQPVEGGVLKEAVELPADPPADEVEHSLLPKDDDCGCDKDEGEACSNCDPEDEIASSSDEE